MARSRGLGDVYKRQLHYYCKGSTNVPPPHWTAIAQGLTMLIN
jgi:hypothetical protein